MSESVPSEVLSQLGECTEWVEFGTQTQLAQAVGVLLGCHRHSFVVVPSERWSLCVSKKGLECLENHFSEWVLTEN